MTKRIANPSNLIIKNDVNVYILIDPIEYGILLRRQKWLSECDQIYPIPILPWI